MKHLLHSFIPENSLTTVSDLLEKYPVAIKIVKSRATKHGDFRVLPDGRPIITLNNNLNKYHFLLTLIHELAHYVVHYSHKRNRKPHGPIWKMEFQHLMLPLLNPEVYPSEMLPLLANYLKNPKASTSSDIQLTYALKQYDEMSGKSFIFEIHEGNKFMYRDKTYVRGSKRRTRYECRDIRTNKIYLFNRNAEVEQKHYEE